MGVIESAVTKPASASARRLDVAHLVALLRIVAQSERDFVPVPSGVKRPALHVLEKNGLIEAERQRWGIRVKPVQNWQRTLEAKLGPDWRAYVDAAKKQLCRRGVEV